jgi:hypothetical protein
MLNQPQHEVDTFKTKSKLDDDWRVLFSELCYEVFYKTQHGAQLLALLENRYFRSPVAHPNREPSFAYFNEGQNEMIRSFTMGINAHLSLSAAKANTQKELSEALPRKGRARKPSIRPVR